MQAAVAWVGLAQLVSVSGLVERKAHAGLAEVLSPMPEPLPDPDPRPEAYAWGWTGQAHGRARHFPQKQDHFDESNSNTWMQAYFVNKDLWHGANSGGPVYLFVGGEGKIGRGSVTENFLVEPEKGVLILSVEHRYYGCYNKSSCPYEKALPGNKHLQHLTSRQALADLAQFHAFATKEFGLSERTQWIAFGGSYPGMLAAYLRAEYPHLFHAAVASSAPVKSSFNPGEFNDLVTSAYALDVEGVKGSKACADAISTGHAEVGDLLASPEGRQELARVFEQDATWLEDPVNQVKFAACGVARFPAQSNDPYCSSPGCGISQICSIMTDTSRGSEIERLAAVSNAQQYQNKMCEIDWIPGKIPRGPLNYWGYQTCTEFGFYQVCEEGSACFFTKGLWSFDNPTLGYHPSKFCEEQFDIDMDETKEKVAAVREYYDGMVQQATNIMWVNGNTDPWASMSHLNPTKTQPVVWPVQGAGHCAWMSEEFPFELESIKAARREIFAQVEAWIGDYEEARELAMEVGEPVPSDWSEAEADEADEADGGEGKNSVHSSYSGYAFYIPIGILTLGCLIGPVFCCMSRLFFH